MTVIVKTKFRQEIHGLQIPSNPGNLVKRYRLRTKSSGLSLLIPLTFFATLKVQTLLFKSSTLKGPGTSRRFKAFVFEFSVEVVVFEDFCKHTLIQFHHLTCKKGNINITTNENLKKDLAFVSFSEG